MSGSGDPTLPIFSPDPKLFLHLNTEKNWFDFLRIIQENIYKQF